MTKELRRHRIEVSVLTGMPNYPTGSIAPGYRNRWRFRELIDGVPVRRTWIYAGAGRSTLRRLANYMSFSVTGFLAALFGPRPDLVFVEAQPLSLGVGALLLKWLRGVPYIYNVPDLQIEVAEQLGFIANQRVLRLATSVERLVARKSWKVATVTERFIDHFVHQGVPREQVTFLPNGADVEFLKPQPPDRELLDRWQLRDKRVFLYVGTHAHYHGLEVIIEAASRLRDRADIVFLLIGQGSERERLRQQAAALGLANVVFDDSPYEERSRLYSIAYASLVTLRDIAVASQMRPAKIFPSLSAGVPVICSARGETADLVVGHNCGVAVPPGDAGNLARAIAHIADDPDARMAMARAGRAFVEREYSWSFIVTRWLGELGIEARASAATAALVPLEKEPA